MEEPPVGGTDYFPRLKCNHYPNSLNSLGDHIRARWIDLGLFQAQVASQIGVHELTICNWEGKESQPAVKYMPAIIRFLGYNPKAEPGSLSERLIGARRARGLSQRKMAEWLGVDPGTIQGSETGQHRPSPEKFKLIVGMLG